MNRRPKEFSMYGFDPPRPFYQGQVTLSVRHEGKDVPFNLERISLPILHSALMPSTAAEMTYIIQGLDGLEVKLVRGTRSVPFALIITKAGASARVCLRSQMRTKLLRQIEEAMGEPAHHLVYVGFDNRARTWPALADVAPSKMRGISVEGDTLVIQDTIQTRIPMDPARLIRALRPEAGRQTPGDFVGDAELRFRPGWCAELAYERPDGTKGSRLLLPGHRLWLANLVETANSAPGCSMGA